MSGLLTGIVGGFIGAIVGVVVAAFYVLWELGRAFQR